jgi:hypothetical protein
VTAAIKEYPVIQAVGAAIAEVQEDAPGAVH